MNIHITAAVLLVTGLLLPAESNGQCQDDPPPAFEDSMRDWLYESHDDGTSVYYLCKHGFELTDGSDHLTSKCENGAWSALPSVKVCEPQCLEGFPVIENGYYDKESLDEAFIVRYHCNDNFHMVADTLPVDARCAINFDTGKYGWSLLAENAVCTPDKEPNTGCQDDPPAAKDFIHRTWEPTDKIEGSIASYTCNYGFRMNDGSDSYTAECHGGTWSALPSEVECEPKCDGSPSPMNNADFDIDNANLEYGLVPYKCNDNFHMVATSVPVYILCGENNVAGEYSWMNVTENAVCEADSELNSGCQDDPPAAKNFIHRTWEPTEKSEGSIASYKCNYGFRMSDGSDSFTAKCLGGTWSALPSGVECESKCDEQPSPMNNADFDIDNANLEYGLIPYKCNDNFHMVATTEPVYIRCGENKVTGEYSWMNVPENAVCEADSVHSCGHPQVDLKTMNVVFDSQEAIYSCTDCYRAIGKIIGVKVLCNPITGEWDYKGRNNLICEPIDSEDCGADLQTSLESDSEYTEDEEEIINELLSIAGLPFFVLIVMLLLKCFCFYCFKCNKSDANSNMETGIMPLVTQLKGAPQVLQPGIPSYRSAVAVIQPIDVMRLA